MLNPWWIVVAIVTWGASLSSVWIYRGHIDAGDRQLAIDQITAQWQQAEAKAQQQSAKDTSDLQVAVGSIAQNLNQKLLNERLTYGIKIADAESKLAAIRCPVSTELVGLLTATASQSNGVPQASNPGPGAGSGQASGAVEAGALIASCETNRLAFDRNADRLDACLAAYKQVKNTVNK